MLRESCRKFLCKGLFFCVHITREETSSVFSCNWHKLTIYRMNFPQYSQFL